MKKILFLITIFVMLFSFLNTAIATEQTNIQIIEDTYVKPGNKNNHGDSLVLNGGKNQIIFLKTADIPASAFPITNAKLFIQTTSDTKKSNSLQQIFQLNDLSWDEHVITGHFYPEPSDTVIDSFKVGKGVALYSFDVTSLITQPGQYAFAIEGTDGDVVYYDSTNSGNGPYLQITSEEPGQPTQCNDGLDNDNDGLIDLNDPGCQDENDDNEVDDVQPTQCSDNLDNDNDGLIDLNDPGCEDSEDDDETDPILPECSDGVDNDNDGLIDLNDPGCTDANDNNEVDSVLPQCNDGLDNDNDGLIDLNDPGCQDENDDNEVDDVQPTQCSDNLDNDNDGLIDLNDPGCEDSEDDDETDPIDNGDNGDDTDDKDDSKSSKSLKFNIRNIKINNNDLVYPGNVVDITFLIDKKANSQLKDLRITLRLPKLGIVKELPEIDLANDEWISTQILVPSDTKARTYLLIIDAKTRDHKDQELADFKVTNVVVSEDEEVDGETEQVDNTSLLVEDNQKDSNILNIVFLILLNIVAILVIAFMVTRL